MKKAVLLLVLLIVSGCMPPPPSFVDLSDTIYPNDSISKIKDNKIAKLIIENTARAGKPFDGAPVNPLKSVYYPIHMHPPTPRTVAEDIRRYLEQRFTYDFDSKRIIRVQIKEADVVYVKDRGAEVFIPIIGGLLGNKKSTFVMNLNLTITTEEDGKQVFVYVYNEPIVFPAKVRNPIPTFFYPKLIAAYRQKLFSELDAELVK